MRQRLVAIAAVLGLVCGSWARPLRPTPVGPRMTRDFVDTELAEVIRILAQAMGRKVYLGPGVKGRLTVALRSVSPTAALHEVLASFSPSLGYKLIGNEGLVVAEPGCLLPSVDGGFRARPKGAVRQTIELEHAPAAQVIRVLQTKFRDLEFIPHPVDNGFWVVGLPSDIQSMKKLVPDLDIACQLDDPSLQRESILIKFGDLQEIRALLQTLVPDARISCDVPQNTLIVEGTSGAIEQAQELVRQLDKPLDQIILECKLVRVTPTVLNNYTVEWTREKITATPSPSGLRVGRFKRKSPVTLLPFQPANTTPSLAASLVGLMNGETGRLQTGDNIPESNRAAIALELTPTATVLEGGAGVHCSLHGRFSFVRKILASGQPQYLNLTFDGDLELKDSETAVVDGLLPYQVAADAATELPWLADLPILGQLFRCVEPDGAVYLLVTPNVMK